MDRMIGCRSARATAYAVLALTLGLTAVAAGGGAAVALGAAPQPLNLVYAQASASVTPIFVAQDQGFFAAQGLRVSMARATGNAAIAALLSGEAQVTAGVGATEVSGADANGADAVIIAAGSNLPVFSLYAKPDVHSVKDLAGKKIAVTRAGTSTDTMARIILDQYKLTGQADIVPAGGTLSGVLAAVERGVAAAGILAPPATATAQDAGLVELVNGVRLGILMTMGEIGVTKSYLAHNRDIVLRFMKAYVAAWAFMRNPGNEAGVERAISHYTRATPEQAAVAYRAFFVSWRTSEVPYADPAAVRNVLRFSANPRVRGVNPNTLIDPSVLDELVRSGYVRSLYHQK